MENSANSPCSRDRPWSKGPKKCDRFETSNRERKIGSPERESVSGWNVAYVARSSGRTTGRGIRTLRQQLN